MATKKEKKIKRSFRVDVIIDGVEKEFSEGMGPGVIGSQVLTFNLTQKEYDGPMFPLSLSDQADAVRASFIRTAIFEV